MILQQIYPKCATMNHLRCIKMIAVMLRAKSFMAVKTSIPGKVNSTKKTVNIFKMNTSMVIKM